MHKRYVITDERKISTKLISLGKFQPYVLLSWKLHPSIQLGHEDTGEGLDMRGPHTIHGVLLLIVFYPFPKQEGGDWGAFNCLIN